MTAPHRSLLRAALLALSLGASACTPTIDVRGNQPLQEDLDKIVLGKTSRDEVQQILGTPSSVDPYGEESWQYISSKTETVAFFSPELKERNVVAILFDKAGKVKNVIKLDLKDGKPVQVVARETPSAGKDLTILEQLVGNVGRFSKDPKAK